jgi:hypothetical protein
MLGGFAFYIYGSTFSSWNTEQVNLRQIVLAWSKRTEIDAIG